MSSYIVLRIFWIWILVISTEYVHGHVAYNTNSSVVKGKLNVHLVPHSHDDVGWLKTVDQYYTGSNFSIQDACIENVIDSVVMSLLRDPSRKFIYVEMAFFNRWWEEQNENTQDIVRKLVSTGQLEFVNGGWSMHDEATCHYVDMIDQTTLGHRVIKDNFNVTPRSGWQVDPFGHSAVQAYLLGAEAGFDSVHFARIDYQDRKHRLPNKSLEVVWRGSQTFGSSSQIFANTFVDHYYPPKGFLFEVNTEYVHVQDDPLIFDYNVQQRVNDFIVAAIAQANVTRSNHIMWTMGGDFMYQYAESWFKQMDKLIHYVNKDGRINALYSTPSLYTDAKNAANESWPLKTHDYFPYADSAESFWTGYFSSRPALKRYVRMLSGYYLAARQLEFFFGRKATGSNSTYSLGDALGILQHHDAVTGTAQQHTTDDYSKRLAIGASQAEVVVSSALSCLTDSKSKGECTTPSLNLGQCQLQNISYCPPTEENIPVGKSLVIVAYNSLGWNRTDIIRIPVNDSNLIVQDSTGNTIVAQFVEIDNVTVKVRNFYTEAYLGFSPKSVPKYWLLFQASLPPLGWNTYFVSRAAGKGEDGSEFVSVFGVPTNETVEIGPGNLKMSFSSATGKLTRMYNSRTRVDIPVQQSFLWYGSNEYQGSGAYIFNPNGSAHDIVSKSVPMKVVRGPLVEEVHQNFSSWIYQVVRLYKDKEHADIEYTIGPIPIDGNQTVGVITREAKEVITRMSSNMKTNKVFYTDSNGRDFLKRVRDYREDWSLQVTERVAGNYYPLNLGIYTTDSKSEFSVLVDRATGGASIKDGEVELMLHRRLTQDDSKGVEEALNEEQCAGTKCEGITVRGNYYVSINKLGAGSKWRRTTGQEIYAPILLAFTNENKKSWTASRLTKRTMMDVNYSLPPNVALITLQELDNGSVLFRLAHLYEASEDAEYSTLANVELKKIFAGKTIKGFKETSLTANQEKSQMKSMTWRVEGADRGKEPAVVRGGPIDPSTLIVELGPMEIRTLLLTF